MQEITPSDEVIIENVEILQSVQDDDELDWSLISEAAFSVGASCMRDGCRANKDMFPLVINCFKRLLSEAVNLTDSLKLLDNAVYLLNVREPVDNLEARLVLLDFLVEIVGGAENGKAISCYGKWREIFISHMLTEKVNVLKVINGMLTMDVDSAVLENSKAVSCINFISEILRHGTHSKLSFESGLGFVALGKALLMLKNADQAVINSLFSLMTDSYSCNDAVIRHGEVAKILISLIPILSADLQRCVCESFRVICVALQHNILLSCHVGLLGDILNVLEQLNNSDNADVIVCLISIMEILGSFSITAKELRQLLALFVVKKCLANFISRLVQALERMSASNQRTRPRYFVDFYDASESFSLLCPSIHKWEGKGITFHTWISLDHSLPSPKSVFGHSGPFRHILYSFQSSTGEGFEAFFTEKGYLVLAVITKKEYLTSCVTSCPFTDCEWHALTIVHQSKHFNKSIVTVLVDGIEIHRASLRYPHTDDLIYPHIGRAIRFNPNFHYSIYHPKAGWTVPDNFDKMAQNSIPAGQQNSVWGDPHILLGQLSAVYMFNECLPLPVITEMVNAGPNLWHIFSPSSDNDKRSLGIYLSKIVLRFNAKDVSSIQGNLHARICSSWDIRASISCLGDIKVLFPIVEEIILNSPKRRLFSNVANDDAAADTSSVSEVDEAAGLEMKKSTSFLLPRSESKGHLSPSSGSFVVIPSSPRLDEMVPTKSSSDEGWLLVDGATRRSRSFTNWLCRGHDVNGLAHFFALIRNIVTDNVAMQKGFLRFQGPEILGFLLQRCSPHLLTVGFLMTAQSLVEFVYQVHEDLHLAVLRSIFFDFRIWCRADVSVQIAHIQQLSIFVKDKPQYFRKHFGVRFLLNSLLVFHVKGKLSTLSPSSSIQHKLTAEDRSCLRSGVLGLILFVLKSSCNESDLDAVAHFLCHPGEHVDEAIGMIHKLVDHAVVISNNTSLNKITASAIPICLLRYLVYDVASSSKHLILQTLNAMLASPAVSGDAKARLRLSTIGFSAVTTLLSKQAVVSRACLLQLLKMAQVHDTVGLAELEIFRYYDIVLNVVEIIPDLPEQLEICLKIRNSLKANADSAVQCAGQSTWYRSFLLLLVAKETSSSDHVDVMGEELVFVVVEIINLVLWRGCRGSSSQTWEERGAVFAALRTLSSEVRFFVHPLTIEKMLYTRCLESAREALVSSMEPISVVTQNAVKIIKVVNHFLLRDESHETTEAREHFLKWDAKLLDAYSSLLNALNVWEDSTEGGAEWKDIIQHVERVLLLCIELRIPGLMAVACRQVKKVLSRHHVDGCGEFFHHVTVMTSACHHITNDSDAMSVAVDVLRRHLLRYVPLFELQSSVPNLLAHASSKEAILFYIESQEYLAFVKDFCMEQAHSFATETFASSDVEMGQLWMQWLTADVSMTQVKAALSADALQSFSKDIESEFQATRDDAHAEVMAFEGRCQYQIALVYKSWEQQKEMFEIGIGAWQGSKQVDSHWRLSFSENVSRMHLKLERNKHFDDHREAASLRDTGASAQPPTPPPLTSLPGGLGLAGGEELNDDGSPLSDDESGMEDELNREQDDAFLEAAARDVASSRSPDNEGIVGQYTCTLVHLLDTYAGRLVITKGKIAFYDESETQRLDALRHFVFHLNDLRELHTRRHNLQKNALEFFLLNRTSQFVRFENRKVRDEVYGVIMRQKPPNIYFSGIKSPSRLLSVSGLTSKWVRREITNFDYIMQLNTIAGRTFNDLAQYPVFPWLIADYTSETLDLTAERTFRDLSKPIGCLVPEREEELKVRYDTFYDPSGVTQKSHHFTHYSNPAGVIFYLLRLEPFTSLHIYLQGGKFDCADRQFYSIPATWHGLVKHGNDAKELIPEFFYLPEFMSNSNGFDLGRVQSGKRISDVELPPWARDPDDFIRKHRNALECDHVSAHLHHWIDLIFGYKQRGKAAIEAVNVFQSLAYEGAVDLDTIPDPMLREAAEGIINNFGQVPCQLMTKPHPCRKPPTQADKDPWTCLSEDAGLKLSLIELQSSDSAIITVRTARHHSRSIIYRNMPDTMITVDSSGFIGLHSWLSAPAGDGQSFTFVSDPLYNLSAKSRSQQGHIDAEHNCALPLSSKTITCSSDGQLIVAGGFWDNTVRIYNQTRKQITTLFAHQDVVSCLSFDVDHDFLVSGSRDHTCAVFKITSKNGASIGVESEPRQMLYGHCTTVTCVAAMSSLDLVVSGDEDGACLIHTLADGQLVHSLCISGGLVSTVLNEVVISELGKIVITASYLDGDSTNERPSSDAILVYNINGKRLQEARSLTHIDHVVLRKNCLATAGAEDGLVSFRNINEVDHVIASKTLRTRIDCLAFSANGGHLIVGKHDGSLIVVSPS